MIMSLSPNQMQSEKMTDLDSIELLSNISDRSFIFLENGSMPLSVNSEIPDEKNQSAFVIFESNRSQCNRNTLGGSFNRQNFSEGEIQERLKELIGENNQLKETLSQNNLAIKSQLNKFYTWQQEILKTHETHKEKFLEMKDLILKLRAENLSMKRQLSEGFITINDDDFQISKKDDCDYLKQEAETLKSTCEDLTSKNEALEMENMKLRENLKAKEKEVFKLSSELEDSMRESNFLKQKNDELEKNSVRLSLGVSPNSEIQAQECNLLKELEVERSKSLQLREKLKNANDIISKAYNVNIRQGVDEYLKSLEELNLSLDHQNQRLNTLQSLVTLTEEKGNRENQNLGEIKEAGCHLCQKEKTCEEKHKNIQELKDQFSKLLEDCKVLQEQVAAIQNSGENKINDGYQALEGENRELPLQEQENTGLQEYIKKPNLQREEVEALKAQVEAHKNDFNEGPDGGEKEAKAEQPGHMQSKLEVLEEPNDNEPKKNHFFCPPYKRKKGGFLCSKCMFTFVDFDRCVEHIEDCVNAELYL